MITVTRYHDICAGHRVVGHEGKCKNLHGHNYRITFEIAPKSILDDIGRVIDFSMIKSILCEWLEKEYDHKMLIWEGDPLLKKIKEIDSTVVTVPFNPTAENIASHLLNVVCPALLPDSIIAVSVDVSETRKCSAKASIKNYFLD